MFGLSEYNDPVALFYNLYLILMILSSYFGLLCGFRIGEAEVVRDKKTIILWFVIFFGTQILLLFLGFRR